MIFCPHASRHDLPYCLSRLLLGAQWTPITSTEDHSTRVRPHSQHRFREATLSPKPTGNVPGSLWHHFLPSSPYTVHRLFAVDVVLPITPIHPPGVRYCVLSP